MPRSGRNNGMQPGGGDALCERVVWEGVGWEHHYVKRVQQMLSIGGRLLAACRHKTCGVRQRAG